MTGSAFLDGHLPLYYKIFIKLHMSIFTVATVCFSPNRLCSIENRRARFKGCLLGMLGFTVPLLLLVALVLGSLSRELLELMLGDKGTEALSLYVVSMYVYAFMCMCVWDSL